MRYFELTNRVYIKKDIDFRRSFEIISRYISFSMAQIDDFLELHNKNRFKFYVFNNFYPIERDRVYKRGGSYEFNIRSLDESLIEHLSKFLRENINNPNFLVIETQKKEIKYSFVSELYSITPVIATMERGVFWTKDKDGDIFKLYKQLHNNLERKYNSFYNKEIHSKENFIQLLELKNQKPQTIQLTKNGKPFRFFGNKFKIIPHSDEISQKLAFTALACGLGEKNAFGGGFCV